MTAVCLPDLVILRPTDLALDMTPADQTTKITQTTESFCSSIGYTMNPPIQVTQILYSPHGYQIICTNDEPYPIVVLSSQSNLYINNISESFLALDSSPPINFCT